MVSERAVRFQPRGVHYAHVYALVGVILVLVYLAYMVWTTAVRVLAGAAFADDIDSVSAMRSVIQLSYVGLGLGAFLAVLGSEAYLRAGISGRRRAPDLRRRSWFWARPSPSSWLGRHPGGLSVPPFSPWTGCRGPCETRQ
jgi:hypothetical protein